VGVAAAPAGASVTCFGSISHQVIHDALVVPAAVPCTLNAVTVQGAVLAGRDSRVTATDATVEGAYLSEGSNTWDNVFVKGGASLKYGDQTLKDGSAVGGAMSIFNANSARLDEVQVAGDLHIEGPLGTTFVGVRLREVGVGKSMSIIGVPSIVLDQLSIRRDLLIVDSLDVEFSGTESEVGGTLACFNNHGRPIFRTAVHAGRVLGQCA
jgi:hypothetical protein